MVDSVIAGTGNSRYLRTSLSASTTWEEALTMLREGAFPIDLAGINLAGFTTLGTALNSATLLKSAVITALGLSADATPSDAWDAVIALISEKADADSTVTSVAYNSSTHKLTVTIDGVTTDVVTITPPPVNSVNTKTGDVVLGSGDIAYSDSATYPSGSVGAEVNDLKSQIGDITTEVLAAYSTDTASGAVASFPDGAAVPVKDLTIAINPAQSGSGDPAPDNVRLISGWTQAKVTRTGKNLLTAAPPWGTSAAMVVDLGKDVSADSVVIQFKANNTSAASTNAALIDLRESDGTHHYSTLNGYRRADGTYFNQKNTPFSGVFSVRHQNIKFRYVYTWYTGATYSSFDADTITDWQITIADAVSDYEAPAKQTITIDLDGTIYGGTLDVLTGVLTVDRRYTTIGAENVTKVTSSNYANFQLSFAESDKPKVDQANVVCISSALKGYSFNDAPESDDNYVFANPSGAIRVKNTANAGLTSNEWKTLMADVQLCYMLATPLTVQLPPTEVSTLLGANNIWADTGDTTVNYRADVTLYIDKLTGSTEEDMIADAPIASGKYFLVGNRLFLSTASIAAGATLTPGTNCTETNLAAALNALNS